MTEATYWQRFRRSKLARRTLLQTSGSAILGIGAATLFGCGGSNKAVARGVGGEL